MPFALKELPYALDALEPYISSETMAYHHGKHQLTYVNILNRMIENTSWDHCSLEYLICNSGGNIQNYAAQLWNHQFYWEGMKPGSQHKLPEYPQKIVQKWGNIDNFRMEFIKKAAEVFGSGWAWLVVTNMGELSIEITMGADNPMIWGKKPVLCCDVWEHAYYIDKRNRRPAYLHDWFQLIDWEMVQKRIDNA